MLHWNNNLQINASQVIDLFIKDVHKDLKLKIINSISAHNIANTKTAIEQYIRKEFITGRWQRKSKQYWMIRGWTEGEAYVKSKENKPKNASSVYSREFWLKRVNPKTNKCYTETEADYERNSRRPIRPEYWLSRGYSESDAIKKALETKDRNNKKALLVRI